jgi:peptidoglycan hydrolase FlgJ
MDVKATLLNSLDQTASTKIDDLTARSGHEKDIAKIKKLSSEFESVFMEQMFKSMRQSVQKSGLIDGGNAEEIYTSMLDSEYAKQMSGPAAGGLAQMIEKQLLQTMGVKSAISAAMSKQTAVNSYRKVSGGSLQPGQKEVTIKPGVAPAIEAK